MANVPKTEANNRSRTRASAGQLRAAAGEEKELVRRAKGGDVVAYEALVHAHQQRVFAVVSGILRRREDIEDVAQQVFVKAYFSLERFDQRSAFGTWLYKIAVNECWDYLRK
jgi:RNA polymerase sigma-70 factor (ECF subfamily)